MQLFSTLTAAVCVVFLFTLITIYHKEDPEWYTVIKDGVNFKVEMYEMPDDMFEYTLAAVSAGYEIYNGTLTDVVPYVQRALQEKYDNYQWFVIVNSEQSSFRGHYYVVFTATSANHLFFIGNLLGCEK